MAGRRSLVISMCLVLAVWGVSAAAERIQGSAVVRVGDSEYLIPIECKDAARPQLGVSTEPSRITREATGRSSGVRLNIRPWKETEYFIVSLDRYVTWVSGLSSGGGVLQMKLDMSPASSLVNGMPQALTFDRWLAGAREIGITGVSIEANCTARDPAAPAFKKLQKQELDLLQ